MDISLILSLTVAQMTLLVYFKQGAFELRAFENIELQNTKMQPRSMQKTNASQYIKQKFYKNFYLIESAMTYYNIAPAVLAYIFKDLNMLPAVFS